MFGPGNPPVPGVWRYGTGGVPKIRSYWGANSNLELINLRINVDKFFLLSFFLQRLDKMPVKHLGEEFCPGLSGGPPPEPPEPPKKSTFWKSFKHHHVIPRWKEEIKTNILAAKSSNNINFWPRLSYFNVCPWYQHHIYRRRKWRLDLFCIFRHILSVCIYMPKDIYFLFSK